MDYIYTPSFLALANSVPKGNIIPHKRLRQGCPLSSYLFLLCAEGLSSLISRAEVEGSIMGFACKRTCPKVSHLFFADDSLLFCRAKRDECRAVKNLLGVYERASEQVVNGGKSSIMFSPNVTTDQRLELLKL